MTYCTPFLLSLGLSKSKLSLVWVAGPLSGLVMQPVIGMISDRWTGRWGRRRPFMVGGTAGVVVLLLLLGWCETFVGWFVKGEEKRRMVTIVVAVVDIYVLDFVINVVQSCCRSLIVDTLPVEKQQLGSAWGKSIPFLAVEVSSASLCG
jgi:solute carrier family 45 protein 1/2/4